MDEGLLSLKWDNHQSTFFQALSELRRKEIHTDVTLTSGDKFYPAHQFILSTCSDYFCEVFSKTPCKSPVIVLKDINYKQLESLLDYMYLGEVDVQHTDLINFLSAAEYLKIKGLIGLDNQTSGVKRKTQSLEEECLSKILKGEPNENSQIDIVNSSAENGENKSTLLMEKEIKLEADPRSVEDSDSFMLEHSSTFDTNLEKLSKDARTDEVAGPSGVQDGGNRGNLEEATDFSNNSRKLHCLLCSLMFTSADQLKCHIALHAARKGLEFDHSSSRNEDNNKTMDNSKPFYTIDELHSLKKSQGNRTNPIPEPTIRQDGLHHWPSYKSTQNRCKMPGCSMKTYIHCGKCNTYLCFTKDRNCFGKFHSAC